VKRTRLDRLADAIAQCRGVLEHGTADDRHRVATRLAEIELALRSAAETTSVERRRRLPAHRPRKSPGGLRIAVSLRQFGPAIGGTGIYTRNVIARLARDHGAQLTLYTTAGQAEILREVAPGAAIHAVADHSAGLSLEQDLDIARHDVLFCPLSLLDPARPPLPCAVTIHGLGHEFHPDNFDQRVLELRRRTYRPAAMNADVVLTVSEFSRSAIAERYGIDPQKIVVASPGVGEAFSEPASLEPSEQFRELSLPSDYLYYPANYWPHKNHENLLRAFKALVSGPYPDLVLVLSGSAGPDADRVRRLVEDLGLASRVRMLEWVAQPLVCELMRYARVVTFVTQFEGFGIPIVEAFYAGTPLITSTAAACREQGGDAALYAAHDDPAEIATQIRRLLDDPQLARELSVRGKRRAELYSWDRAVATIATEFERIAGARAHAGTSAG
jgi:glycosyltransferase involved in cell wall biosynthesis